MASSGGVATSRGARTAHGSAGWPGTAPEAGAALDRVGGAAGVQEENRH